MDNFLNDADRSWLNRTDRHWSHGTHGNSLNTDRRCPPGAVYFESSGLNKAVRLWPPRHPLGPLVAAKQVGFGPWGGIRRDSGPLVTVKQIDSGEIDLQFELSSTDVPTRFVAASTRRKRTQADCKSSTMCSLYTCLSLIHI